MYSYENKHRFYFLDYLKVFLCILVVAHHWAIANGAPGDWYLSENYLSNAEQGILSIFVAVNQSFFMALFFLISGFFVPVSHKKKGSRLFLISKLKHLGIPLIVFTFILSPIIQYLSSLKEISTIENPNFIFLNWDNVSVGPMWFLALLFIFNTLYVALHNLNTLKHFKEYDSFISENWIWFAFLVGLISFTFRIFFSVGIWLPLLGIQLAHLPQYLFFYILGIMASEKMAIKNYSYQYGQKLFLIAQFIIVLAMIFLSRMPAEKFEYLMGGFNVYSLIYSVWEQLLAFTIIPSLLIIFYRRLNTYSSGVSYLSKHSFAVYFMHSIVLVIISLIFLNFKNHSFTKFLLLLNPAIVFSFLMAIFVRKIPGVNKII